MPRPVALVTGASSGIGRCYAARLAGLGYDLVVTARRKDRLDALVRELGAAGAETEIIVADLTTRAGVAQLEMRAAAGDLQMLVNNAGFQTYRPFAELDPERAEEQIEAQVTAIVRLCRAALPAMLARGSGDIVNVSSTLAFSAGMTEAHLPKRAVYAATKAFVNAFTEILAGEVAGTGVRVQALCPGVVRTEFHDVDGEPKLRPKIPLLEPEDVVTASLAALDLGDVVCLPALSDRSLALREAEARHAMFRAGVSGEMAARYRKED